MNPAFLALGVANAGLLPLAFVGNGGASRRQSYRPAQETPEARNARHKAQAVRREEYARTMDAWLSVPGNSEIYARQKQTLARLRREWSALYEAKLAEIDAAEAADRIKMSRRLRYIATAWIIASLSVWGGIAWIGAPWGLPAGVFAGLMFLMWRFLKAVRDEEPHVRQRFAVERDKARDFERVYPRRAGMGPHWTYPILDPLDPVDEVQD